MVALLLGGTANAVLAQGKDCKEASEMAASIMDVRQTGVPTSGLAALLNLASPDQRPWLNQLAKQAYEVEVFGSEEKRQQAVLEFKEKNYQACMKGQ